MTEDKSVDFCEIEKVTNTNTLAIGLIRWFCLETNILQANYEMSSNINIPTLLTLERVYPMLGVLHIQWQYKETEP